MKSLKIASVRNKWPLLFVVALLLYPQIPDLLTKYMPVVDPLTVTSFEPAEGEIGTILAGYAEKHRNCSYQSIEWHLGKRAGGLHVPITEEEFREKPRLNPRGLIEWTALYVPLSWVDISDNSFADVWHKCPVLAFDWPLWLVDGRKNSLGEMVPQRFVLRNPSGDVVRYWQRTKYWN